MEPELKALQDKIEDSMKTWEEFKTEHKKAIKESREENGEFKEKFEKMAKDITDAMEEKQKLEARLAALETLGKQKEENDTEKKSAEMNKHFDSFLRKNSSVAYDFKDYLERNDVDVKTLSVNSEPDGGFFVMPQFGGMVTGRVFETSPIRQLAETVSISTDAYEFIMDDDEATSGGWVSEEGSRSTTATPQVKKMRIETHEQYADPKVTQKMLDDSSFNVEQWLAGKVSDIMSRTENTAFVTGDGIGKPRGILTYDAWSGDTYATNKIQQVNSGSNGAFTSDGILQITNKVKEAYQSGASFLCKRASFYDIIKLKDSQNNYLFNRDLSKDAGSPFNLIGKPVYFADDMPAVATNALSLAYGNFRMAYLVVDRIGIRVLRDPYSSKPYIEYYTTKRVGGGIQNFEAIKIMKLAA